MLGFTNNSSFRKLYCKVISFTWQCIPVYQKILSSKKPGLKEAEPTSKYCALQMVHIQKVHIDRALVPDGGTKTVIIPTGSLPEIHAKVMFLHVSVILSTGGGVSRQKGGHPLTPTWTPHPSDGHCSGRYASYWNAF